MTIRLRCLLLGCGSYILYEHIHVHMQNTIQYFHVSLVKPIKNIFNDNSNKITLTQHELSQPGIRLPVCYSYCNKQSYLLVLFFIFMHQSMAFNLFFISLPLSFSCRELVYLRFHRKQKYRHGD